MFHFHGPLYMADTHNFRCQNSVPAFSSGRRSIGCSVPWQLLVFPTCLPGALVGSRSSLCWYRSLCSAILCATVFWGGHLRRTEEVQSAPLIYLLMYTNDFVLFQWRPSVSDWSGDCRRHVLDRLAGCHLWSVNALLLYWYIWGGRRRPSRRTQVRTMIT